MVRALFWSYPLFISRTTTNLPFENEPYHLKGNRCLFTWTEPFKNVWNFSFKLKKERLSHINKLTTLMALPGRVNLYDGYCDVYGHDEIDCYVLQVTCQNYQSFLSVMGLVLCNVYLKVSQESRFYCLRLHFDTSMKESTNQNRDVVGDTVIFLDRVVNLKVFPWWHSKYPFKWKLVKTYEYSGTVINYATSRNYCRMQLVCFLEIYWHTGFMTGAVFHISVFYYTCLFVLGNCLRLFNNE